MSHFSRFFFVQAGMKDVSLCVWERRPVCTSLVTRDTVKKDFQPGEYPLHSVIVCLIDHN